MNTTVEDLELRRGDTRPALVVTLDDDGAVVDLTNATTVTVVCKPSVAGVPVIRRATTDFTAEGVVTMQWQDGDTDVSCTMKVEFEVIWPDFSKQTFPASNKVQVYRDLG